jgi:hypothetical protein
MKNFTNSRIEGERSSRKGDVVREREKWDSMRGVWDYHDVLWIKERARDKMFCIIKCLDCAIVPIQIEATQC